MQSVGTLRPARLREKCIKSREGEKREEHEKKSHNESITHRLTDDIACVTLCHNCRSTACIVKTLRGNANVFSTPFIFDFLKNSVAIYCRDAMLLRWSCGGERCEIGTLCASAKGVIRLTHGIHTRHNIFCRWRSPFSRLDGKLLCTRRALMDTKIYRKSFDVKDSSPKCQSQRASPVRRVL